MTDELVVSHPDHQEVLPLTDTLRPGFDLALAAAWQPTIRDAFTRWVDCVLDWLQAQKAENTRRNYWRAWCDFFAPYQPHNDIADVRVRVETILLESSVKPWAVSSRDVNDWYNEARSRVVRGKPLKGETINLWLSGLSSFYKYASMYTVIEANGYEHPLHERPNPFRIIKRPGVVVYYKRNHLNINQLNALLAVIPRETVIGARNFALLTAYMVTGRRNSEMRLLKWGDLIFEGERVMYHWFGKNHREGKAEAERFQMPEDAWRAIELYLNLSGRRESIQPGDYVFVIHSERMAQFSEIGKTPLSANGVNDILKQYARRAGIDPRSISIHGLRHSLAHAMLDSGAKLNEVCDWLGHANVATTMIYTRDQERLNVESINRVSDQIGVRRLLDDRKPLLPDKPPKTRS